MFVGHTLALTSFATLAVVLLGTGSKLTQLMMYLRGDDVRVLP